MSAAQLSERLKARNVHMLPTGARRIRCVTHLDVNAAMIDEAARAIDEVVTGRVAVAV